MGRASVLRQQVAVCGGLLLVAVCLPTVHAISCYQCNSFEHPGCSDVMIGNASYDHLLKPCDGDYEGKEPFCRKTVQTLQRDEPIHRVRRTCSWVPSKNPCYSYEDDDHMETVCQCYEDGCNAAPTPAAVGVVTALGVVVTAAASSLRPH